MKILVIEDSPRLRSSLENGLGKMGFDVDAVGDGNSGISYALSGKYEVVILDLMLPGKDGESVLRELKEKKADVGILVLSAKSELDDKVYALTYGADDYLTKPFEFSELQARLNCISRRRYRLETNQVSCGNISIDIGLKAVRHEGVEIRLTPIEYTILEYLVVNKGRVITYEKLEDRIYKNDKYVNKNTLEVHVSSLRKKLAIQSSQDMIKTKRGFGYYINGDA